MIKWKFYSEVVSKNPFQKSLWLKDVECNENQSTESHVWVDGRDTKLKCSKQKIIVSSEFEP